MKQQNIEIAAILDSAAKNAEAVDQVSKSFAFDLKDSYEIQALSINRRYERGETSTGLKLGFTSKAKMEQMGVHDIIWGRLTDQMDVASGESFDLSKFIHPRVEPEIAFLIKKEIDRPISLDQARDYLKGVAGALEIIDSRYKNFKFSLEDVVADNCSSAAYKIGKWHPAESKINHLLIQLMINDELAQSGSSDAILGNPLESLVEISRLATADGLTIPTDSVILAGAATSAVYLNAGDRVEARFENLGNVTLDVG